MCGWPEGSLQDCRDRLSSQSEESLLILDNCDDEIFDYGRYIPNGTKVTILMATRLSECRKHATVKAKDFVRLEGLTETEATDLIFDICQTEQRDTATENAAKQVASALDYHPLAITAASSLIEVGESSLLTYTTDFDRVLGQKTLLETYVTEARYKGIYNTFEITAQALSKRSGDNLANQDALDLLSILALLDRHEVPEQIFIRAWSYEDKVLGRADVDDLLLLTSLHVEQSRRFLKSPPQAPESECSTTPEEFRLSRFRKARALLSRLSLIALDPETKAVSLHSLVHVWARQRIQDTDKVWSTTASILALSTSGSPNWKPFTAQLQTHIESIYTHDPSRESVVGYLSRCQLYLSLGWQLYFIHSLKGLDVASMLLKQTKSICGEKQYKWMLLDVQYLHVSVLLGPQQKRYKEAIEIIEEIMQTRGKSLKEEWTLNWQSKLADAYRGDGQVSKAVELLEHIVQEQEGALQSSDANSFYSEHKLAETRFSLAGAYLNDDESGREKQVAKAIQLLERALQFEEGALAEEDPNRLLSQYVLAQAYLQAGDDGQKEQIPKAMKLLEHVVEVRNRVLSKEDPRRLESQFLLAKAYLHDGQNGQTEQIPKAILLLEHITQVQAWEGHEIRHWSEELLEWAHEEFERTEEGSGRDQQSDIESQGSE